MKRRAALFDLDRTLVRTDTARLYTRYRRDRGEASLRDSLRVALWAFEYTLGVIDAPRVATQAVATLAGKEESWLTRSCEEMFSEYVLPEVQARGREAVDRHKHAGDMVAIVTGATVYAARPVARELGIEHIVCTELIVDEAGLFTGGFREPICYGAGKLALTRRLLEREAIDLEHSTFFSDSITDLPLLSAVEKPVVVNPDRRLLHTARERGWPIERW